MAFPPVLILRKEQLQKMSVATHIVTVSKGLAIGTNGTNYILTGNNEWVKYNGNASSGSSGGTGTGELIDIESITDEEIKSLF